MSHTLTFKRGLHIFTPRHTQHHHTPKLISTVKSGLQALTAIALGALFSIVHKRQELIANTVNTAFVRTADKKSEV